MVTKSYRVRVFGAADVTKPYKCTGFVGFRRDRPEPPGSGRGLFEEPTVIKTARQFWLKVRETTATPCFRLSSYIKHKFQFRLKVCECSYPTFAPFTFLHSLWDGAFGGSHSVDSRYCLFWVGLGYNDHVNLLLLSWATST